MFAQKIKYGRRSMWTSTILHEPGGVPMVAQSKMNRHKFIENPKIFCNIYRLLSKNGPIIPLEEIAAHTINFGKYRDEGTATLVHKLQHSMHQWYSYSGVGAFGSCRRTCEGCGT
ncbi:hypothetical protein AVEN_172169-1 [Araneus ventricosus]|uniref:Uncharacterized protein n=1 Tax=Araneus ventricosus TaxID=182803 RepID=A0A4Y2JIX8_ARAVE|nr:hypothetical protein AVEN_172169-1 [Araneus ventricosus]